LKTSWDVRAMSGGAQMKQTYTAERDAISRNKKILLRRYNPTVYSI
jgi:hypothetical protein